MQTHAVSGGPYLQVILQFAAAAGVIQIASKTMTSFVKEDSGLLVLMGLRVRFHLRSDDVARRSQKKVGDGDEGGKRTTMLPSPDVSTPRLEERRAVTGAGSEDPAPLPRPKQP